MEIDSTDRIAISFRENAPGSIVHNSLNFFSKLIGDINAEFFKSGDNQSQLSTTLVLRSDDHEVEYFALKDKVKKYDTETEFLASWKPKKYVPGTKMNYNGIKKPEDRAAMLAWLRTLSSSPTPLPSAAEIAKEVALLASPEEPAVDEEATDEDKEPSVDSAAH